MINLSDCSDIVGVQRCNWVEGNTLVMYQKDTFPSCYLLISVNSSEPVNMRSRKRTSDPVFLGLTE